MHEPSPTIRVIRRSALALSLVHGALALFHLVALDLVRVSCPTFAGGPYQFAYGALFIGALFLLPLWLIALITLGMGRRWRDLLLGLAGVAAIILCVQRIFAVTLFYCDADALAAALNWHSH